MGAGTRTYWPSMSDYQEAVQSPQVCFADKDLRSGSPVLTALGLPRPICGAFASVYELEQGGKRWAIKCFLRNIPDQHKRYAKISDHLHSCGLPYFVTFDYLSDAILVQGKKFPLVKMEWVEAEALNQYVVQNLNNPQALKDLEARWLTLLDDLKSKDIAHGDLQHGNVLVDPSGQLRLIDYDGMWVPALKGEESHETGHADYQSPYRRGVDFHENIDEFSGIVIRIALRALATNPELWKKYDNGENLLLKRQDYVDPQNSAAFAELQGLGDPEICDGLDVLRRLCAGGGGSGGSGKRDKKAEKKRAADEKRFAEEKRRQEEQRRADEKKKAEDKRRAHEQRLADEKKRQEEKRLEKERKRQEHKQRMADQKRRADEKKAAQKAAAAKSAASSASAAPKPAAGGPSWMADHAPGFGTARPAAPARSRKTQTVKRSKGPATPPPKPKPRKATRPAKPTRKAKPTKQASRAPAGPAAESTCGLHHLLVHCIAVAPAFYLGLRADVDILRWTSWFVVGMSCISLLTRMTLRSLHRGASTAFFGFVALAVVGNTVFELCTVPISSDTEKNILEFGTRAALLITCIVGILMGRRMDP